MNTVINICDEDFVSFLHGLGVETFNKSFEWMLNDDPEFAGALRWLYHNLDQSNALTAREEYRYVELEKKGLVLSSDELQGTITSIQEQYPGICLPGDNEALEEVKRDINMKREQLNMLEKHEKVMKDLVGQNEIINEELNVEMTKLHAAQQQCSEDESTAAKECLALEEEVETLTENILNIIGDTLELYANCQHDKDTAKKFLQFGPLEQYKQTQALFRSHFDLFTSKNFNGKQNNAITNEDLQSAMVDAKNQEERLSEAILAYVESKAELSGEQAKLALVSNYYVVHPSKISDMLIEGQTALQLVPQQEQICLQRLRDASSELVTSRTAQCLRVCTQAAASNAKQHLADLTHLLEISQQALSLDRLLYCALRHELRNLELTTQFAAELKLYSVAESDAVKARIELMNEICSEQDACVKKLESRDLLAYTLNTILGQPSNDPNLIVKLYSELQGSMKTLFSDVKDGYKEKAEAVRAFKRSLGPLLSYIYSGCTKSPQSTDAGVSSLTHELKQRMAETEERLNDSMAQFTTVKNGDKQNLRKLWQWFLTDQERLLAAIKDV